MAKNDKALTVLENQIDSITQQEATETAHEVMGAIKSINSLTQNLDAQVIHALQRFRDEKLYESLDFTRFDDYLDKHPRSPMSYASFNRREKLLEIEGDENYNLLQSLGVPATTRKSLPPASFEIIDDQLIVSNEKGVEVSIPLSDTRRVKSVIAGIAREVEDNRKKLANEVKKTEALTKRNQELAKAKTELPDYLDNPHGQALLLAVAAIGALAKQAEQLTPEEVTNLRVVTLDTLGAAWANLNAAYHLPNRADLAEDTPKKRKIPAQLLAAAIGD